jgi:hypothetical protein
VTYGDSKLGVGGARQQPSELLCGGSTLESQTTKVRHSQAKVPHFPSLMDFLTLWKPYSSPKRITS